MKIHSDLNRAERIFFRLFPLFLLRRILPRLKRFKFFVETSDTQTPVSFHMWYYQKVIGHCIDAYWPVHSTSVVSNPKNIFCGIETSPGFSPGNYIQAVGKIFIDDYTQIGPNVGIISANHDLYDNRAHKPSTVKIGKYCWIGMGAIILPGVELGDFTVVGAGAVVSKSFPSGFCVIAGNPAKCIKQLDSNKCIRHKSQYEYNGYIPNKEFEAFRNTNLNI